jgi:hypothetical protein
MRKFITIAIAMVLTVAGCTASSVEAFQKIVPNSVRPWTSVVKSNPLTKSDIDFVYMVTNNKEVRNHIRMTKLLKYVKTRVNKTPYVFSGSSIYGWDCSGMVRWLYGQFGLDVPHSANKQAHVGTRVSTPVPGDVVVFAYAGSTNFYHSAIYIGNGKVINANYGSGTTIIEPLSNYKRSQIRYVRIVEQERIR